MLLCKICFLLTSQQINTSTLGSPPLLELLKTLKPKFWFSAHLHVRFAALFKHSGEDTQVRKPQSTPQSAVQHRVNEEANDEEIKLEDDLEMEENIVGEQDASNHFSTRNDEEMNIGSNVEPTVNGEEIVIENDDGLEEKREGETEIEDEDPKHGPNGDAEPISLEVRTAHDSTRFLALSKCLEGQDFLQVGQNALKFSVLSVRLNLSPSKRFWISRHLSIRTTLIMSRSREKDRICLVLNRSNSQVYV